MKLHIQQLLAAVTVLLMCKSHDNATEIFLPGLNITFTKASNFKDEDAVCRIFAFL